MRLPPMSISMTKGAGTRLLHLLYLRERSGSRHDGVYSRYSIKSL